MNINGYEITGRMPIFTRENRNLIRQGVKTQTRRVMKPQPEFIENSGRWFWKSFCDATRPWWSYAIDAGACPYGKPGDIRVMPEPLSSLFMPTWAGRTIVRYTRIWAARLREINSADAYAEGVERDPLMYTYVAAYAKHWDSINGKTHPWASNPWAWCIEWELLQ